MTAFANLAKLKSRMSGDSPVMSAAWDRTIVDIIAQVSDMLNEELRNVRGQHPGWTFLAAQTYGVQQVSVSGKVASGTFTLTFGASTTGALVATIDAPTLQTAMDGICGIGNTVVTGAPGGPWTITFAGTLTGAQPVLVPTDAFVPPTTGIVVEELVTGSASTTVVRRYTAPNGFSSLLPIDDCVAVTAVSLLDDFGNVSQTLVAGQDYLPWPLQGLPIMGLQLTGDGWWPRARGACQVTLQPGFATSIPANLERAALQESIRSLRGAQANEDDRLGVTPFGSVVVSRALLESTLAIVDNYSSGSGFLRTGGF